MDSHELAVKLLGMPPQPVLLWVYDPNTYPGVVDWMPVRSFTVGAMGVKLSEYHQEVEP